MSPIFRNGTLTPFPFYGAAVSGGGHKNTKKIILKEIQGREECLDEYIEEQTIQFAYYDHPLWRNIIGSFETVKKITRNQLLEFHEFITQCGQLVFLVTGNVTEKQVKEVFESNFQNWNRRRFTRAITPFTRL